MVLQWPLAAATSPGASLFHQQPVLSDLDFLRHGSAASGNSNETSISTAPLPLAASARTADLAAPRSPRSAQCFRQVVRGRQSLRCSHAVSRRHAATQTLRTVRPTNSVVGNGTQQAPVADGFRDAWRARVQDCSSFVFREAQHPASFFRVSVMLSLRRCLMRSSSWLQNRRKYCPAETSALITTSQNNTSPRSASATGWRTPRDQHGHGSKPAEPSSSFPAPRRRS